MSATATEEALLSVPANHDTVEEDRDVIEELVVEEISIDGMCGVY